MEPGHFHSQFFTWCTFPAPNSLFYLLTYLLSLGTNIFIATQLVLSLYVLSVPVCDPVAESHLTNYKIKIESTEPFTIT